MITVLIPSRGRPEKAAEAMKSAIVHQWAPDTQVVVVIDSDDPQSARYTELVGDEGLLRITHAGAGSGMGAALNVGVLNILTFPRLPRPDMVGFIGDDHRMRTPGWDRMIEEANAEIRGGICYGDDLIRGIELPSAVFMDSRIVKALGWMALPGAKHLYLDDTWRELGRAMKRLKYRADVIVEHVHPIVGKGEWDENYVRVNTPAMYEHDKAVYEAWLRDDLMKDAATALAALR